MRRPHAMHANRVNELLAALQDEDRSLLASALRIERPPLNLQLSRRNQPTNDIWFPHDGVIALSVTDHGGRTVQAAVVGSEGCIGLENIFLDTLALTDASVQIAGYMSVIAAPALRAAVATRPLIQSTLTRFLYDLSAQSLQTIACNRLHTLEARCCRWLLMMRDRTSNDVLPMTQERLAAMLASGRPRINALLSSLENNGLLVRHRSRICLLHRPGLEARACECYRILSSRQELLWKLSHR